MSQEKQGVFKDPEGLTKWTKWLLYAQVVIGVIAIISSILEYQLLSDFKSGVYSSQELAVAAAEASDARQGIVGIIQFIIFVVSGILILKWIFRANYNARQLGASEMVFTPGWSIGWYFIPIANLWKPYQAMKEIWKASSNPQSWSSQSVSSLLPWWWFFWIVYNMFANAPFRSIMRVEGIYEHMAANVYMQLLHVTGIPLSLIVIAIINRVHTMQMSHATSGKINQEMIEKERIKREEELGNRFWKEKKQPTPPQLKLSDLAMPDDSEEKKKRRLRAEKRLKELLETEKKRNS